MHIKARASARDHAGHHFSFHAGKVLGPGDFHITLAARDNGNRLPERFQQGGIIRDRTSAGCMGGAQSFKPKGLRGLGAKQPLARHGGLDQPARYALQRISHRLGGDGTGMGLKRGE